MSEKRCELLIARRLHGVIKLVYLNVDTKHCRLQALWKKALKVDAWGRRTLWKKKVLALPILSRSGNYNRGMNHLLPLSACLH